MLEIYENTVFFQIFKTKIGSTFRTPWSSGLILHVLDQRVKGLNLVAAKKKKFQFKSTKISLWKSEQMKKGKLSLIASARAVAVGEEEEMRKERESINLMWWHHLTVFV